MGIKFWEMTDRKSGVLYHVEQKDHIMNCLKNVVKFPGFFDYWKQLGKKAKILSRLLTPFCFRKLSVLLSYLQIASPSLSWTTVECLCKVSLLLSMVSFWFPNPPAKCTLAHSGLDPHHPSSLNYHSPCFYSVS